MDHDPNTVAHNRFSVWTSSLLLLLLLAGFVLLVYFLAPAIPATLTGLPLVLVGILLSLAPALVWLAIFYVQDRLEPEPKGNLFGVFFLGGLLAAAIGQPLINRLFQVQQWMYESWWVQLLASILIIGFVQEFLKFAAVRFSIYHSSEFDERVDGVIYAVAAGLGYATVLNFAYVMEHGGVDLGVGVMTVAINALAQASFAGITGYFLGQAKFETTPAYWLPLGVSIAAVLNGLFFFLEDRATLQGFQFTPLNGVLLAAAFALVIFAVVFFLIRRANAETLAIAKLQQASPSGAAS